MYLAWIPTIRCDLLFEFTDPLFADYDKVVVNLPKQIDDFPVATPTSSEREMRRFAFSSVWNCKDSLATKRTGSPKKSGEFRFLVSGTVSENRIDPKRRQCEGFLLMVLSDESDRLFRPFFGAKKITFREQRESDKQLLTELVNASHLLNRAELLRSRGQKSEQTYQSVWERLKGINSQLETLTETSDSDYAQITKRRHFLISFKIHSDGVCVLKPLRFEQTKNLHGVIQQAYNYLKYSLHAHAHHGVHEEAILSVQKLASNESWAESLWKSHRDLMRSIIQLRRRRRDFSESAAGILAYANSLRVSIQAREGAPRGQEESPKLIPDHAELVTANIAQSLDRAKDERRYASGLRRHRYIRARERVQFWLLIFAPLITWLILKPARIPDDHYWNQLQGMLPLAPVIDVPFLIILGIYVMALWIYAWAKGQSLLDSKNPELRSLFERRIKIGQKAQSPALGKRSFWRLLFWPFANTTRLSFIRLSQFSQVTNTSKLASRIAILVILFCLAGIWFSLKIVLMALRS